MVNAFGRDERRLRPPRLRQRRRPVRAEGAARTGAISPAQFVDFNTQHRRRRHRPQHHAGAHRGRPDRARARSTGPARSTPRTTSTRSRSSTCAAPTPARSTTSTAPTRCARGSMRNFGTAANQVLWRGQAPLIGDPSYADDAVFAVDRWLARVARRPPQGPAGAEDHPGQARHRRARCTDGDGNDAAVRGVRPDGRRPTARRARAPTGPLTRRRHEVPAEADAPRRLPGHLHRRAVGSGSSRRSRAASATTRKPGVEPARRGRRGSPTRTQRGRVIYGGKRLGRPPRSHRIR